MKRAPLFAAAVLALAGAGGEAAAAGPRLLKGPYLTGLTADGVDVRFELDGSAPAGVELTGGEGRDAAPARTVADGAATMHAVHVAGLEAGSAYEYAVHVGGAVLGKGRFVTAPAPSAGSPVKFLVYGDVRSDEEAHGALVRSMMAIPSDFLVNTGDVVAAGGSASDWQTFFQIEQPLLRDRALFLCVGNHELYDDQAGASFARYFGFTDPTLGLQPFGTMRWGIVRLFFLNGMHDWKRGPEREWLERELAAADKEAGVEWRIAVVHHGPWSSGPHGGNTKLLDAKVPELLAAHKVDLVLAGHDHIYERGEHGGSSPLKYVISGGGGAPLYPIEHRQVTSRKVEPAYHFVEMTLTKDALKLVARRLDGTTLEACGFARGQPWDCDPAPTSEAPGAVPGQASGDAPATPSRCGCEVPGASGQTFGAAALALGAALAAAARRRRG